MQTTTLLPGRRIGSFPYEVIWPLDAAYGTQSQVYLAKLATTENDESSYVAVKVVRAVVADHPPPALAQEVAQLCRLKHPGIVRIFPLVAPAADQPLYLAKAQNGAEPRWFSVREYIAGGSLTDLLAERALDLALALEIGRELASTLDYIHSRGQVHGAINPYHVLFRARPVAGKPVQPVLIGFGHADPPSLAEGKRGAYLSSESPVSSATDIYFLGVLLYEMLTGRTPETDKSQLTGSPPSQYNPTINQQLDQLILQMINPANHVRPSAAAVAIQLETIAIQDGYLRHYPSGSNDTVQSLFARRRVGQWRLRWGVIVLGGVVILQWLWMLGWYWARF